MNAHSTDRMTRVWQSTMGGWILRPWFDAVAVRAMTRLYFPVSRAWATAAAGKGISYAAERTRTMQAAYADAEHHWRDAFFGGKEISQEALRTAQSARQKAALRFMAARAPYLASILADKGPAVAFDVADEDAVRQRHAVRLENTATAFAWPDTLPTVTASAVLISAHEKTSWIRFASPDPSLVSDVWARVREPVDQPVRATLILAHGVTQEDEMWGGETVNLSPLIDAGYRIIQPDGPWHARRRLDGYFGGEPVFARGVMGVLDYFHLHVREIGRLTAWAHETADGPVAIGGISLGALTTQLTASVSVHWPSEMQADALMLIVPSPSMIDVLYDGSLTSRLTVPQVLAEKGWTRDTLECWRPLREPTDTTVMAPDRIVMVLGSADDVTPFATGKELAERWRVSAENMFVRRQGHFSATFGLSRDPAPLQRLIHMAKDFETT